MISVFVIDGAQLKHTIKTYRNVDMFLAYSKMMQGLENFDVFYTSKGNIVTPETDLSDPNIRFLFVFENCTMDRALYVIKHKDDPPDPILKTIEINAYLKHELIIHTQLMHDFVVKETDLAFKLEIVLRRAETKHDVREALVDYLDFDTNDNMWERLWQKILQIRQIQKNHTDRDNPITSMKEVMTDYRTGPNKIISALRSKVIENTPILIMIQVFLKNNEVEDMYDQFYIVRPPSTWIYLIMHPKIPGTFNLSILLHSITAHAITQLHPNLTQMRIVQPYKHMKKIFEEAKKKYGFTYQDNVSNFIFNLTDDTFTTLWRMWTCEQMCVNCCLPALFRCTLGYLYCNKKCQIAFYFPE